MVLNIIGRYICMRNAFQVVPSDLLYMYIHVYEDDYNNLRYCSIAARLQYIILHDRSQPNPNLRTISAI